MPTSLGDYGRTISYLYFLRFSILLWMSLPGLLLLNVALPSLAHGLFALEQPSHYFFVGFFVTLAGCVALLTARLTCAYGEQRFDVPPPSAFAVSDNMKWRSLFLSQIPGIGLLVGICIISIREAGVLEIVNDGAALLFGMFCALLFWAGVSTLYFYSYAALQDIQAIEASEERSATATEEIPAADSAPLAFMVPTAAHFSRSLGKQKAAPPPFTTVFRTFFLLISAINGIGYQDPRRPLEDVRNYFAQFVLRHSGWCSISTDQGIRVRPLLPGHALNIVMSFLSLLIYIAIFPFTAPVPLPNAVLFICLSLMALAITWIWAFISGYIAADTVEKQLYTRRTLLVGFIIPILLLLYLPAGYALIHNIWPLNRFWHISIPMLPAIGPVLMLLILIFWFLAGLSFFLDRFHVPVVLAILVGLIGLHWIVHTGGITHRKLEALSREHSAFSFPATLASFILPDPKDHFVDFACPPELCAVASSRVPVASPSDILKLRRKSGDTRPMIVITATGGGIHAGAWAAEVLAALEHAFAVQHRSFHDSVLLISTVSGGSVGAVPFVRAYLNPSGFAEMASSTWFDESPPEPPTGAVRYREVLFGQSRAEELRNTPPLFVSNTMTSSLEAVSWGIVYPDAFRLLLPSRSVLGLVNLEGYDRGWAMQRRMAVNLDVEDCPSTRSALRGHPQLPTAAPFKIAHTHDWDCLTLRELAGSAMNGDVPAISFNTTSAENGGRFLLANYQTVKADKLTYPFMPVAAESFLHDYGASPYASLYKVVGRSETLYPDLELLSAARLSATFPYVSPMPRIPRVDQPAGDEEVFANALHFGDGGYYDNDGTATAIEFLYEAFAGYTGDRIPILWVEIRDDDSFNDGINPDQCTSQIISGYCPNEQSGAPSNARPEAPLSQTAAPLNTFWKAGHTSISLRDHREIAILENAASNRFTIYHQAFAFKESRDKVQPLSWHLTGRQKLELVDAILNPKMKTSVSCVANWFANYSERSAQGPPLQCSSN